MNSNDANIEKVDLWSTGKCIFCSGKIEEDSNVLNCLHIICKDCTMRKSTNLGVQCKCKMVTTGELIDYSIMPPNKTRVKLCCEQNCKVLARKICMYCKSVYCKPCSKTHPIKNEDHNPILMMTYPLKKEFLFCPECKEKCVEVFCTSCSIMICPLCHLNFHQPHNFKLLSIMGVETKREFQSLLCDIRKDNHRLDSLILMSNENIEKLKSEKRTINEKVDKTINMLLEEVNKRSLEIKKILETNFTDAVNRINENKEVLNGLIKENTYYHDVTSSVINNNKTFQSIQLSKIIKNQMNIARSHTKDMPEVTEISKAELVYDDEQSAKKCVESIRGLGNISLSTIVDLSEFKVTVDPNIALRALENNESSYLRPDEPVFLLPSVIKVEKENNEMIDEDSDSSDFEPLVSCACCNQWTEELISCICCNRFYHNDCHMPPLPNELRPKDPSILRWKCTLCQEISALYHITTRNDSINSSEKKLLERILMELYCQNEDSEHYRDCLNRERYPQFYEKVKDPISLNNIKERLESNPSYYTAVVDVIKDLRKVFRDGKLYYENSHPYYKSAEELEISLNRMISSWMPKLYV